MAGKHSQTVKQRGSSSNNAEIQRAVETGGLENEMILSGTGNYDAERLELLSNGSLQQSRQINLC